MSLTVSQIIIDVRQEIDETTIPTVTQALRLLNRGRQELARDCGYLVAKKTAVSTVGINTYTMPDDMFKIKAIDFKRGAQIARLTPVSIDYYLQNAFTSSASFFNSYYEQDRVISLIPKQETASTTTAINDVAGISAVDTEVTVDSTETFPNYGTLLMGTEKCTYLIKDATKFTLLSRGAEGTTATTHADDVTVTLCDIEITYIKIPTALTAVGNTVETVFEHNPEPLINYVAWQTKLRDTDDVQASGSNFQAEFFRRQYEIEKDRFSYEVNMGRDTNNTIRSIRR